MAVPDAPFKETWPDLGLKQQIIEAANDPQAEWIGFTGGKTQADRYDLSKQVDSIIATKRPDGQVRLIAKTESGDAVMDRVLPVDEVENHIGKDLAAKIASQSEETHRYRGVDLQVGGEGMKAFYDDKLPKRLEKIVKPFGGTVERVNVTPTDASWIARLTPEMKEAIKRGVPLMSVLGAAVSAGLLSAADAQQIAAQERQ